MAAAVGEILDSIKFVYLLSLNTIMDLLAETVTICRLVGKNWMFIIEEKFSYTAQKGIKQERTVSLLLFKDGQVLTKDCRHPQRYEDGYVCIANSTQEQIWPTFPIFFLLLIEPKKFNHEIDPKQN